MSDTISTHGDGRRADDHDRPRGGGVLIVEDDADVRDSLRLLLESRGYAARLAGDGLEALEVIRVHGRPCLILLDLMMPVMDGWAFLGALDRDEALRTVPIVILSASADRDRASKRAEQVLEKPFDVPALLALVHRHCRPSGGT
jgi:CheY-like chemotaxis protein